MNCREKLTLNSQQMRASYMMKLLRQLSCWGRWKIRCVL